MRRRCDCEVISLITCGIAVTLFLSLIVVFYTDITTVRFLQNVISAAGVYGFQESVSWNTLRAIHTESFGSTPKIDSKMNYIRRKLSKNMSVEAENHPQVIFLGDSLIKFFETTQVWEDMFASKFRCLNLGIPGVTVEGLLRRIVEGEFPYPIDGFKAEVVVLLVGTNNVADSPNHIANHIEQIVQNVRHRQPGSQIFVIELFPKGFTPNPYREKNLSVNFLLRGLFQNSTKIRTINLDPGFVDKNGEISQDDMPDALHFSDSAYQRAFEPLSRFISEVIAKKSV